MDRREMLGTVAGAGAALVVAGPSTATAAQIGATEGPWAGVPVASFPVWPGYLFRRVTAEEAPAWWQGPSEDNPYVLYGVMATRLPDGRLAHCPVCMSWPERPWDQGEGAIERRMRQSEAALTDIAERAAAGTLPDGPWVTRGEGAKGPSGGGHA